MSKVPGIIWLIVGLGLVVYLVNSGGAAKVGLLFTGPVFPNGSGASSSPSFSRPFSFFKAPTGSAGPSGSAGLGQGQNTAAGTTPSVPSYEIPKGFTAAQLSPYFHKIRFGGVGNQQISLYTYGGYGEPTTTVDITGWEIKTNRGGEFIPQAVNLYDPSAPAALDDLVLALNKNQYVNFYSNSAPVNLRLNKCLGYLNSTRQFNPPFPTNCPYIDRSAISYLSGACQNYVQSLGGCQSLDFGSPNFPRNDYQCEDYLKNNFTYRSCVADHRADADFWGNEWRVWTGSTPLDPYHDNVKLLDRRGLLVDFYSY